MKNILSVFKREINGYFNTPIAYVFIVIFLFLQAIFTFQIFKFYQAGQADLSAVFGIHPWLFLFLIPAISMRLWAEERKSGTIELLMTLPISVFEAVVGKYLAAWAFIAVALILTFPFWIMVCALGDPDNGVIFASYLGSFLMAGAYLAVGSAVSAATKDQIIAFVITVLICFVLVIIGFSGFVSAFSDYLPISVLDNIAAFSFLTHFQEITKGVFQLSDAIYFASFIAAGLFINVLFVDMFKSR